MVGGRRDRGQLLLVGAVAIAFIILGVIVVFNGVLYTQTISAGDSVEGIDDVSTAERELERGIQGVVQRTNLRESADWDDFEKEFVSSYRNTKTNSKPAIVDVSVEDHENATWVSGDETTVLNDSDELHRIGYFTLTVGSNVDSVTVDVTDNDLEINVSENDGGDCTVGSDENVEIDLVRDTANVTLDDCAFGIGPDDDGYENIEIDDDAGLVNSYDVVLEGDASDYLDGVNSVNAAWSVDIEYAYDSSDLEFERTATIDLYEGEPYHSWPSASTTDGGEGDDEEGDDEEEDDNGPGPPETPPGLESLERDLQ